MARELTPHQLVRALKGQSNEIKILTADNIELREALLQLASAVEDHRNKYEQHGGDHPRTDRAWQLVRRALNDAHNTLERAY